MSVRTKKSNIAGNSFIGIGIGAGCALVFSILVCALLASMINSGRMSLIAAGKLVLPIQGVSGLLGAWISSGIVRQKRVQVCLLTAGVYYLCLLAMTALLFGGQYQGLPLPILAVFLGAGIAALLGNRTKNGKKIRALKRTYR